TRPRRVQATPGGRAHGTRDPTSRRPSRRSRLMSHDHHNQVTVRVTINGDERSATVEARTLLVHYIRDHLGLTGTHWGCDTSNCGVCVVSVDGVAMKSCTVL